VLRSATATPIEFRWRVEGSADITCEPTFVDGKLIFPPTPESPVMASFFASNRTPPEFEMVNRFSQLSKNFQETEFADRFSRLYPHIGSISIEMAFGMSSLFARAENLPQKIPLTIASGGMNKLAAILLAFSEMSGGLILVDEIENGFYYERLPEIWAAILDFARLYNCQVFASTHSAECLNSAAELASKSPEDFCMLRTVLQNEGTKIRHFDGERFASAVRSNVEVR